MATDRKRNAAGRYGKEHGGRYTREYAIWCSMKSRCFNFKSSYYQGYGGRGITMCDSWRDDFTAFLSDMGQCPEGLTLERKDNDGPYSPENCVWATRQTQARNRRSSRYFTYNGQTKLLCEWSVELGLHYATILTRINRWKWSVEKALSTPARIMNREY